MDISEVKTVIRKRMPVIYNGIEYERVLNCVLWFDEHQRTFRYSLKLQDKNSRLSVTKAPMENVKIKE